MKHFGPVIRKRQFEPLRPVLKSWFCVLEDYIDRVPGDLPFWYRERPQVGFFAEAAWRAGWAALEEWGMEKGSQLKPSRGRNDLWIGRGKHEWFIEAKHAWCDIQKCKENSLETRLREALDAARKSAEHLT